MRDTVHDPTCSTPPSRALHDDVARLLTQVLLTLVAVLVVLAIPAARPAAGSVAPTGARPVPTVPDGSQPDGAATTTIPVDTTVTSSPATSVPVTTVADATGGTRPDRAVLDDLSDDQLRRLRSTVVACGADADRVCRWLLDVTGNETVADVGQWMADVPLRVALVLAIAFVVNRMVRAVIRRYLDRLNERSIAAATDDPGKPLRSTQRMATASSTLASAASVAIFTTAALVLLGDLGVSTGPLLAGAGVVGIAIGFGAQNVVRDVLAGLFVLIEDQYGVGDVIDAGRATGRVEDFSLRVTKVRDIHGTLWFVPNGLIEDVGNMTQVWSQAVLDVEVAYGADHERAGEIIKAAADRVWREGRTGAHILDEPQLWGVERLGESGVAIRLAVKCAPADRWSLARVLRGEIKKDLDAAGIEIPFPQQALWIRSTVGTDHDHTDHDHTDHDHTDHDHTDHDHTDHHHTDHDHTDHDHADHDHADHDHADHDHAR